MYPLPIKIKIIERKLRNSNKLATICIRCTLMWLRGGGLISKIGGGGGKVMRHATFILVSANHAQGGGGKRVRDGNWAWWNRLGPGFCWGLVI